jgi:DNA-directed RNA polymerase specialized sigma54-like protein
MISNSLTTKLQQKFAPSQIQFMKLLQLPMQSLEGRIKEELEKNPVLEEDNSKESDDNLDLNQEQEAENRVRKKKMRWRFIFKMMIYQIIEERMNKK